MFDLQKFFLDFFKLPPPPCKKEWIDIFTAMAVHTRKALPEKLICTWRPNETKDVYDYRLANYKPITFGSMNRATDELYRIVSGISYKLNCPENTKLLMDEKLYDNESFILFLQQTVLNRMIEDPNGLLVWLPTGEGVVNNSEKVIPKPYLVCSEDIHYVSDDVIAFMSSEVSEVRVGKYDLYEGKVFYILTKDQFYKLKQIGTKKDNEYQAELVYEHQIGEIPYCTLKGIRTGGYFSSYFSGYLAFGDEAICQFSDWQAIKVTCGFPYIEEFESDCQVTTHINKQSNPVPDGEETYVPPPQTPTIVKSPYTTTKRRIPHKNDNGTWDEVTLDATVPSRRFINPDPEIAKNAEESWQMLIEMAEDALHLNLGRGLLSGDAKAEDKTSQDCLITKIGNNFFDNLFLSSVIYIDAYYNYRKADRKGISIDKPGVFNVKTEEQVLNEITTLVEKKAPAFFVQEATRDLSAKRFSGNKVSQKIFNFITMNDPLYIYSVDDKRNMILSGFINKEEAIRSIYMYSLLLTIVEEMTPDKFIDAPMETILARFDVLIVDYLPEQQIPIIDPNPADPANA